MRSVMTSPHQHCYSAQECESILMEGILYHRLSPATFAALLKRLDAHHVARNVVYEGHRLCVRCAARAIRSFEELQRWVHAAERPIPSLCTALARAAGLQAARCTIEIERPLQWPPGSLLSVRPCLLDPGALRTAFLGGYAQGINEHSHRDGSMRRAAPPPLDGTGRSASRRVRAAARALLRRWTRRCRVNLRRPTRPAERP